MSSLNQQAEDEDCEPCRFAVGIGFLGNICKELKDHGKTDRDCEQLLNDVRQERISIKEFTDEIKSLVEETEDSEAMELFNEIKGIMHKKRGS